MNVWIPRRVGEHMRSRTQWITFGAALLLFILIVRLISLFPSVINPDENMFALAAREVVYGRLPYTTLFDNKPVGSTFIIAAFIRVFGQSILTVRLLGATAIWASAMLIAVLVVQAGSSRLRAIAASLLYVAFTTTMGGLATLTEVLLTPFTIVAVILLHRASGDVDARYRVGLFCLAGLACGAAILIKIVPAVPGVMFMAAVLILLYRRNAITLLTATLLAAVFVIFAALPMAAVALLYAHVGKFGVFFYSNFGFAGAYSEHHPSMGLIAQRLGTVIDSLWPLLGCAVIGVVAIIVRMFSSRTIEPFVFLAITWLVGELAAASASLHFYPHYFLEVIPPLILTAICGINVLGEWMAPAGPWRAVAILAAVAILIPLERTEVDNARALNSEVDVPKALARTVRAASQHRPPTLFVTDYHLLALYGLTGAPLPATRFADPDHLFTSDRHMAGANPPVEVARVLANNPAFIAMDMSDKLPAWAQAQFATVLGTRYRLIRSIGSVRLYQSSIDASRSVGAIPSR